MRRLVSKCVAFRITPAAAELMKPLQLGVGMPGGCEAFIHAANALFHDSSIPIHAKWALQVDMQNAFNLVDREASFAEVRTHFPEAAAWVEFSYGCHPFLKFGNGIILSCLGIHQGDPFGPLLFALTFHPLLKSIKDQVVGLRLNAWFLDDGLIVGTREAIIKVLQIIIDEGLFRGFHLRQDKSSVWCGPHSAHNENPLGYDIPRAKEEGYELLGAPVGTPAFSSAIIHKRMEAIWDIILHRLLGLQDAQAEYALLRSCFALPKFAYCLRSCNPLQHSADYKTFDLLQRDSLSQILAHPLNEDHWLRASLPVSQGGMGLHSAKRHACAAFLSSLILTRSLTATMLGNDIPINHHQSLTLTLGTSHDESLDELKDHTQHALSTAVDLKTHSDMMSAEMDTRTRALLHSTTLPHSGDWLNALPNPSLGLSLHSQEFILAAKYRIGIPVYKIEAPCPTDGCSQPNDMFGDHVISYATDGGRICRHNRLRDAIHQAASHAGLQPQHEVCHLFPDSDDRPGDVFLPLFQRGRGAVLDVTVINTLQAQTVNRASAHSGSAAETAKKRKNDRYATRCDDVGIDVIPLAVETLGGWEKDASFHLRWIARNAGRRADRDANTTTRHLFQSLSLLLQKGNAVLLAGRRPLHPPPIVTGVE
jgi:hypothetical protein